MTGRPVGILFMTLVAAVMTTSPEVEGLNTIQVLGDYVTIVRSSESTANTSDDKENKEEDSDEYFKSHSLRLKLLGHEADIGLEELVSVTSEVEGRGRLKKMLLPILLALKIKAAIVIPIFMSLIAVVAVKGLMSGLVSLLLSKSLALKSLFQNEHHGHHSHYDHHRLSHEDHWTREDKNKPFFFYVPTGSRDKVTNRLEDVVPTAAWTAGQSSWNNQDMTWTDRTGWTDTANRQ